MRLKAIWAHGLIAQSVRQSELNSVVVGSNPAQAKFSIATSKNPLAVNTSGISSFRYNMIACARLRVNQI